MFILKDDPLPAKLKASSASIIVTPEDPATAGLFIPMASISLTPMWATEEGAAYKLKADAVLAKQADDVKPFYFIKGGAIFDPFTGPK